MSSMICVRAECAVWHIVSFGTLSKKSKKVNVPEQNSKGTICSIYTAKVLFDNLPNVFTNWRKGAVGHIMLFGTLCLFLGL